nr:hypothetical protein CFP56_08104 [Quercus suber]
MTGDGLLGVRECFGPGMPQPRSVRPGMGGMRVSQQTSKQAEKRVLVTACESANGVTAAGERGLHAGRWCWRWGTARTASPGASRASRRVGDLPSMRTPGTGVIMQRWIFPFSSCVAAGGACHGRWRSWSAGHPAIPMLWLASRDGRSRACRADPARRSTMSTVPAHVAHTAVGSQALSSMAVWLAGRWIGDDGGDDGSRRSSRVASTIESEMHPWQCVVARWNAGAKASQWAEESPCIPRSCRPKSLGMHHVAIRDGSAVLRSHHDDEMFQPG